MYVHTHCAGICEQHCFVGTIPQYMYKVACCIHSNNSSERMLSDYTVPGAAFSQSFQ